ncbi:hypothetical protein P0082_03215 [Candidatus Haliotispira prima]|uniref:Uncharacterized protein n=1 Tax=Candidatus Haliotispira prima TaxID=3034016 RepID=A0ABY8MIP0_9SPIO|nr:hypothetical protein P0082_03215 [Candidatus Haliotispira prima]
MARGFPIGISSCGRLKAATTTRRNGQAQQFKAQQFKVKTGQQELLFSFGFG